MKKIILVLLFLITIVSAQTTNDGAHPECIGSNGFFGSLNLGLEALPNDADCTSEIISQQLYYFIVNEGSRRIGINFAPQRANAECAQDSFAVARWNGEEWDINGITQRNRQGSVLFADITQSGIYGAVTPQSEACTVEPPTTEACIGTDEASCSTCPGNTLWAVSGEGDGINFGSYTTASLTTGIQTSETRTDWQGHDAIIYQRASSCCGDQGGEFVIDGVCCNSELDSVTNGRCMFCSDKSSVSPNPAEIGQITFNVCIE